MNLTSQCDVTNSYYPVTMTTIRHWSSPWFAGLDRSGSIVRATAL